MTINCLVADDVRHNRALAAHWLEGLGHAVRQAASGQGAWEIVLTHSPDLIVTDIEMPGLSGLELLQLLRRHGDKKRAETPVIVMSSLQDGRLEETAMEFGATMVVRKPLAKHEFLLTVHQIFTGDKGDSQDFGKQADESSNCGAGAVSPTLRRLVDRARRNS